MKKKIAVIGAGAAGIFGAIIAQSEKKNYEVVVFESSSKPLDKVKISGGGRCNVTHNCFDPAELAKNYPRGSKELRAAFHRFQPKDIISWFETEGVKLKAESDGRMFPTTDKSSTIIETFMNKIEELNIEMRYNSRITKVNITEDKKFELYYNGEDFEVFDSLLVTTGNSPKGYEIARSLGHNIKKCVPSLFTFKIKDCKLDNLSGVAFGKVNLTLDTSSKKKLKQTGPLLITHWGLSGPAVLKLSAWGARDLFETKYKAKLIINFAPDTTEEKLKKSLWRFREANQNRQIISSSPIDIPKRYWIKIIEQLNISTDDSWNRISKYNISNIVDQIIRGEFILSGRGIFKEEFVTAGGVELKEVDFKTMESKICPGLFFAGEILDLDGITGGFNFQSAWTTAFIAGVNLK